MNKFNKIHLIAIFVGAFILLAYLYVSFGKEYIKKNISEYHCSPFFIPFAGQFGLNVEKNFQNCMAKEFSGKQNKSKGILKKFTQSFLSIIKGLFDSVKKLFKLFAPFTNYIKKIILYFANKFNKITELSIFLFARMRDLMGRLLGSYRLMLYSFSASVLTLKSTWDGPVGSIAKDIGEAGVDILTWAAGGGTAKQPNDGKEKFMSVCFAGNTEITMKNGDTKRIDKIEIGDELFIGGKVNGVLTIQYNIPFIYNYKGVLVTSSHLVYEDGVWKRVYEANYSKKVKTPKNVDKVFCLITEHHLLYSNNILFTDFEEMESLDLERKWNTAVLRELNCSSILYSPTYKELIENSGNACILGCTEIKLKNGELVKIDNINLDIEDSNIIGSVSVIPTNIYSYTLPESSETLYLGGSVPILENGIWIRVYQSLFSKKIDINTVYELTSCSKYYHLITLNGKITTKNHILADFIEVSSNTVEFFQDEVQLQLNF